MQTLLTYLRVFGITLCGDGGTIKTVPMVNYLDYGLNNPFVLFVVFYFSYHCTE